MKPTTLPVACGVALAIMAGAAATHHHSVGQMVALAALAPESEPIAELNQEDAATLAAIAEIRRQNESLRESLDASAETAPHPAIASRSGDPDLKRLLAELVDQNRFLRDQVAETNRDLMELQFRVDTHSEQFRPLKVSEELTFDDSIGVLPPRDVP